MEQVKNIELVTDPLQHNGARPDKKIELADPSLTAPTVTQQVGKKVRGPLDVSTDMDFVPDATSYDNGYVKAFGDRENYREAQQSAWQMWRNAIGQTVSGIATDIGKVAGFTLDLDNWHKIITGAENDYSNQFVELMDKIQAEARTEMPVFQSEAARTTGWEPADPTWWATHAPSIGSAISFMIPTTGFVKGAGMLGKALGAGKVLTSKTAQIAAKGVAGAVFSRYNESLFEAHEIYDQAIKRGATAEEASEAASMTWKANMAMLGTDLFQYTALAGGFKSMNRLAKFAAGSALEGAEEGYQFTVGQEALSNTFENTDFFGKDFGKRLSDYVEDPEFKTSVLMGAVGGSLFSGYEAIANNASYKAEKAIREKLGQLREAQFGNEAGINAFKDATFASMAFEHLNNDKIDSLIENLDSLSSDPAVEDDARQRLKKYKEAAEFLGKQKDILEGDSSLSPQDRQNILKTQLDVRFSSEALKEMQQKTQKSITDVMERGEIKQDIHRIKELYHTQKAYEALQSKSGEDFSKQIKLYDDLLWDSIRTQFQTSEEGKTTPIFELILTSQDKEIQNNFDKQIAAHERLVRVKEDLGSISTPEGRALATAKKAAKKLEDAALAVANNPKSTIDQIELAKKDIQNPQVLKALDLVIQTKKVQDQKANQQKTTGVVQNQQQKKAVAKPVNKPKLPNAFDAIAEPNTEAPFDDSKMDKLIQSDYDALFGIEQRIEQAPDIQDAVIPPLDESKLTSDVQAVIEGGELVLKRIGVEAPKPEAPQVETVATKQQEQIAPVQSLEASAAKTVLKEYAGKYVTQEDGTKKFVVDRNADTTPKKQDYYYAEDFNTKSNPIPVTEVFASKGENLLVNLPDIEVGQEVIVKIEPNWPFWKNSSMERVAMNIYQLGKNGQPIGKPLAQLPDSTNENTSTEASRALRKAIFESGKNQVKIRIVHKNGGDTINLRNADGTPVQNSIAVLETDLVKDEKGGWKEQKTSYPPILGYVDPSGIATFENTENLPKDVQARLIESSLITKAAPGTIMVARTNGLGTFFPVQVTPRTVTIEEVNWLKANMPDLLNNKDYAALKPIINLPQLGIDQDFTAFAKDKNQKIFIVAGDVLFYVNHEKPFWVKINATGEYGANFKSFMEGNNFHFQVFTADGTKRAGLQEFAVLSEEIKESIRSSFDNTLRSSYKNIDKNFLNTRGSFVDAVSGKKYNDYYTYLKDTGSLTTDLSGKYSFSNSTIYLDSTLPTEKTKDLVTPVTKEVIPPIIPEVKQDIIDGKIEKPKKRKERRNWSADDAFDTRYRLAGAATGVFKVLGVKEISWMQQKFGPEYLSIASGVDKVLSVGGLEAFGYYHNAHIKLAQFAEEGTGYHEAFHFVTLTQLSDKQYTRLINEAQRVYKAKNLREAEEMLAEEFRDYMLADGNYKPRVSSVGGIFQRILDYIRKALGFRTSMERLFETIAAPEFTAEQKEKIGLKQSLSALADVSDLRHRLVKGFRRVTQQQEALNDSTFRLLRKAQELGDKEGVGFDDILSIPANVEQFLNEIKAEYEAALDQADAQFDAYEAGTLSLTSSQIADLKLKGATLQAIIDNWSDTSDDLNQYPGYQTTFIRSLGNYGFSITVKDLEPIEVRDEDNATTTEGEEYLEEDTNAKERIHGVSFFLNSPLKTLSSRMKRFLATVPELRKVDGKILQANTIFDTPKYVDFNRVYANLSRKLANSRNIYSTLTELAATDPLMQSVKNKLDESIKSGQMSYNPLVSEFFTAFNKSSYRFFTVLTGFEDGAPIARIIDTDRRSIDKTLLSDWAEKAISVDFLSQEGDVSSNKTSAMLRRLMDHKAKGSSVSFEENLEFIKNSLADIGVTVPAEVWAKLESSKTRRRDIQQMLFGKDSASLEQLLTAASTGVSPFESRRDGLLSDLVDASLPFVEDLQAKTFINEKGNQVSAINLNTPVTDLINKLTDPVTGHERVEWYYQDGFYAENQVLEVLKNPALAKQVKLSIFSAFRDGTTSEPKEYGETTEQDSFNARLTSWINNDNKFGLIYLGTLSDKPQQLAISLPKKDSVQAKQFLYDVLRNTVNNEIVRIQRINKNLKAQDGSFSIKDIATYKSAAEFKYIPALNSIPGLKDSLTDGDLSPDQLVAYEAQIDSAIKQFIEEETSLFFNRLETLGLISKDKSGNYVNENIPDALEKGQISALLTTFFHNDLAWRMELSKIMHGDYAFYKNAATYFKRGYQLITPGLQGYYNPELYSAGKQASYKRGIFASSIKSNSPEYLAELARLIDPTVTVEDINTALSTGKIKNRAVGIAVRYQEINKTDAQGYSTIEAYRDIAKSVGRWSDDHEWLYENAWTKGLSITQAIQFSTLSEQQKNYMKKAAADIFLQPLKPFSYSERAIKLEDGSTMILKEQYKESITPILPEWGNKIPAFSNLLAAMYENKIDIMSDQEACKVGGYKIASDLSKPIVGRDIPVEDLRFPFFVPEKAKDEILAGTQIEKLIVGNITPEDTRYSYKGEQKAGKDIVKQYHEIWAAKLKTDFEAFKKLFSLDENLRTSPEQKIKFLQDLKNVLIKELSNRELPDVYFDSLQIILNKLDEPEFLVSLDFPSIGKKYEQILTGLFKKNLMTQKLPGDALINLADYGIDEVGSNSELKFLQNKDGKIVEAEVGVPARFVRGLGLKLREVSDGTGKVIWEKLTPEQQEAMQLIIYRIPTQGKNSMVPARIVRILPDSSGSVIMIPGEMTKQGGMDFDVDKSYIMKRTTAKGKVESTLDNDLFDLHWSILTSPAHYEEILNPLDAVVHDKVLDYFENKKKILTREGKNSPFSLVTDLTQEKLAKYSKAMIGIFSKFSVGHATLQSIPKDQVEVKIPIQIENSRGYRYDELGRMRDDAGNYISDNHSALQNSALDAQKDPKLGYLNITTFNAATIGYMTDLGVNQETALYFMNQPVLRQLSDQYFLNGDGDVHNAIAGVIAANPTLGKPYELAREKRIAQITEGNLDDSLSIDIEENSQHQAQVLADFVTYYFAARDMAKVNTALSTDTARDFSSIAAVQSFIDTVNYVTSDDSAVTISPDIFIVDKSSVKRVAAFYEYAIKGATQFVKQFYPYTSTPFDNIRKEIALSTIQRNNKLRDVEMIEAINHAMSIYMFGENHQLSAFLEKLSPNRRQRWSYFNNKSSIGNYITSVKNKFPHLERNILLQALKKEEVNKRGAVAMIGLNNTHGNFDKTNLSNAWWDLLTDPNPEVKTLAYDLVRFAIETSGFKTTPTSFIDLIPAQFIREQGLASYYSAISQAYKDNAKTIDVGNVTKVLVRHLYNSTKLVPSIRFNIKKDGTHDTNITSPHVKDGRLISFTAQENTALFDNTAQRQWSTYARAYDKKAGVWRLYERQGTSNIYKEIQPLGERNQFVQFTDDGNAESVIPKHKGIRPAYLELEAAIKPANPIEADYAALGLKRQVNTAESVLNALIEQETDQDRLQILKNLLPHVDKLGGVKVVIDPSLQELGMFDPVANEIYISSDINSKQALQHAITHELLHAYSLKAVREASTPQEVAFKSNLQKLYNETKDKIKGEYGAENLEEFIAELASNTEFRDRIRAKSNSLWERIVRAFRRLLGLSDKYDTIIQSFYDVLNSSENFTYKNGDIFYLKKETAKKGTELERIFAQIKQSLSRQQKRLKATGGDYSTVETTLKQLDFLDEQRGLIAYMGKVITEAKKIQSDLQDALKQPDQLTAKRVLNLKEQIGSYSVVNDIRKHVHKNPDLYKSLNSKTKTFLQAIDETLGILAGIKTDLDEAGLDHTAKLIQNNTAEKVSLEEIKEKLIVADRDVSLINRGLDAIADSRDIVLRTIGKIVINAKASAYRTTEKLLKSEWLEVNERYDEWVKQQGIDPSNLRERNKFILDPKSMTSGSSGINFLPPGSKEAQAIMKRGKGDPLFDYYNMILNKYLEAQKAYPRTHRSGLRIPSVRRSDWELITEEKGTGKLRVMSESVLNRFRRTYDETDRQATDEAGKPLNFLPIRFISKQDGKEGRMTTREVSLDVASTVLMFIDEANQYKKMNEVVHELELAKDALANRKIARTQRKSGLDGLLSSDRVPTVDQDGNILTTDGKDSQSFKHLTEFVDRMVYGKVKKDEGSIKLGKTNIDIAKTVDTLLQYTGVRMLLGNLNVALSNVATGEATILKEAIGGRWFNLADWRHSKKMIIKEFPSLLAEIGQVKKTSKLGVVWEYMNVEDKQRGNLNLGKDRTRTSRILDTKNLNFLNESGNAEMTATLMFAVMNKMKVTSPDGKEVSFYEVFNTEKGVPTIKKGYLLNGKQVTEADIDKVRNRIIAISQKINGIYNTVDSSGIKATAIGRAVLLMRGWLKSGIDARWKLENFNERLEMVDEGYYISSIRFFKNTFGKDGWLQKDITNLQYLIGRGLKTEDLLSTEEKAKLSEEEQIELANLRRSNIKKMLFEMYLISALAALAMLLGGDNDDDETGFLVYQIVRLKRELSTFFSPTEAWSTLRSPSVALDTIQRFTNFVGSTVDFTNWQEEYEQGPNKGENKVWAAIQNQIPIWSQRNQFVDLDRKADLIERGWR